MTCVQINQLNVYVSEMVCLLAASTYVLDFSCNSSVTDQLGAYAM